MSMHDVFESKVAKNYYDAALLGEKICTFTVYSDVLSFTPFE